ncbi:calcium-dependent lipid-binding (CaLB domain) family protein [Actinidia rufa]|uniref:Calcium-dependent lipid-binding (CaLB domain) family protein n=1 Tax=Actinidia rufa TaxID=165716 RepID=A0A7J0F6N0_9ERIC|nr:calcium-dependent lipid-binding (CaLB domain) family protein [Actinidia rufa]
MGFVSSVMGFFGFGMGITIGLVIGYYLFIYFQPRDVKDPVIRPLVEQDSQTLQRLLPEIPLWVKNPDFDHVDCLNKFIETMWPYLDKPHVNFGLKLLGADAMSIPCLYRFVQVGKHDKMGSNVIPLKELTPDEPKVRTLDLLKNMDPNDVQNEKLRGHIVLELMYKPFKDDEIPKEIEDLKSIEKALEGTPECGGLLVVIVHEAQDLEGKHHMNSQVCLLFQGEEKRTREEEFQFMLEEWPTNDRIHIEVVSTSSRMGLLHPKEALGHVDINFSDVVTNKRINERYHLIDSKNGRVQI